MPLWLDILYVIRNFIWLSVKHFFRRLDVMNVANQHLQKLSLTWVECKRWAWYTHAASRNSGHCDHSRLPTAEVCEGAACSVWGAGVVVLVCSLRYRRDHVPICLCCSIPGHMTHITSTLQGHVDICWRARSWSRKRKGQLLMKYPK